MTQPTMSKHWRKIGSYGVSFNPIRSTPSCYNDTAWTKNIKYTYINKHKWIYAQWNGPSVTKPNPENCKKCSSKWLCTASVYNTTQNSSDSLPSYLQPTIIAQMLSIGGEGRIKVRNWPHYNCHVRWWQVVGLHSWSRKQQTEWYE